MSVFLAIFLVFLAFYILYSFYLARHGVSMGEFMIMHHGAGPFLVGGAFAAGLVSAVGMIGISGQSYQWGYLIGILQWGMFLGYVLTAYLIGHRLRRLPMVTVTEFLAERFQSNTMRIVAVLFTLAGIGFYFLSQLTATGVILEMTLGIPYTYVVVLMAVSFIIVAMTAGAKSVTVLDTVMWVVIVVTLGLLLSPAIISKVGLANIQAYKATNPAFYTFNGQHFSWGTIIGWQILWAFGGAANPTLVSRAYLAKDSQTWIKGITLALPLTILTVWLTHFAAGAIHVVKPDLANSSQALTWGAMNLVSPFIGALAISGLFAAVLSTAATQLLYLGQTIGNDLYKRYGTTKEKPNEKMVIWITRIAIAVIGLIAIPMVLGNATMVNQFGNIGSSIISATFFPALVGGLYIKRVTTAGVVASMIGGGATVIALYAVCLSAGLPFGVFTILPWGFHPVIWGVLVSFVVMAVVSAFSKPTEEQVKIYNIVANVPENDKPTSEKTSSLKRWNYGLLAYTGVQTIVLFILSAYLK